ncbi:MAG: TetR/AcrR family transcriptional regulator [Bacteroidetes bacterium]|nr:TetR/AcrR family transcriptional regulator [Bacteroidota bacterium]
MQTNLSKIKFHLNTSLFRKDPETSDLGRKLIMHGIDMIAELGFDDFTFRKLAIAINSTEASIYRYFENKYKFLIYITSWYWEFIDFQLGLELNNIPSPTKRLEKSIQILTTPIETKWESGYINLSNLHNIIANESQKSFLIKDVDKENNLGAYFAYKQVVARVSDIILEINKRYEYPNMLASTMIEGAHLQMFFAEHLPRLTNTKKVNMITKFYTNLIFKAIKN